MSESGQAGGSEASAPTDLQQVLQLLMEDRRQREEIAAERRQWEEETERRSNMYSLFYRWSVGPKRPCQGWGAPV